LISGVLTLTSVVVDDVDDVSLSSLVRALFGLDADTAQVGGCFRFIATRKKEISSQPTKYQSLTKASSQFPIPESKTQPFLFANGRVQG
jgi:hypothetical protein